MAEPAHSFLLRCWEEPDGEHAWRFLLIEIDEKREKKAFASLEAVFAYLKNALKTTEFSHPGTKPGL
jgi:hypothetical protein